MASRLLLSLVLLALALVSTTVVSGEFAVVKPATACEYLFAPGTNTVFLPTERLPNSTFCKAANATHIQQYSFLDNKFWVSSLATLFPQSDCQFFQFFVPANASQVTDVVLSYSGYNSDSDVTSQIRVGIWNSNLDRFVLLVNDSSSFSDHGKVNYTLTLPGLNTLIPTLSDPITVVACANFDASDSTPILYTWNGNKYTFVDETGRGFLGSRASYDDWSNGKTGDYSAQLGSYPHSYTAFPSSLLQADGDDKFSLKLTSEKEEISFVDAAELWAIDHANDVVIYADYLQKSVVHAVQQPETPLVGCVDHNGLDCTALLASNDHNAWLQDTDVSPSFVELDFGLTSQPTNFKLVVNIRWYKNPAIYGVAAPLGLKTRSRLIVQQWDGSAWVNTPDQYNTLNYPGRPKKEGTNIHFTRTSLIIDVTGLQLDASNRKLRLVFNDNVRPAQIDSVTAAFDAPAAFTKTVMPVETATLAHRGRSRDIALFTYSFVDSLDYYNVDDVTIQPWVEGYFTNYGTVTSLLSSVDDEFVIMGRGDEISMEFDATIAGTPSASRSFIFYNANYYKAQSRAYGQTVNPLPFAAMGTYPYNPNVVDYDTTAHASYLQNFNQRYHAALTNHHSLNTDYIAADITYTVNATTPTTTTSNNNNNSSASMVSNWVAIVLNLLNFLW